MPPQGNQSSNSTPAVPPGYNLDAPQSTPPLPPGYQLDSAQPPEQHWYSGVGDTLGREVSSLAKTVAGVPGGIYHAFADEPTPEEKQRLARNENQQPPDQLDYAADRMVVQPIHVAADWYKKAFQGKIPDPVSQALDVAPEAMGIGAAGPITEKLVSGAPGAARTVVQNAPKVVTGAGVKAVGKLALEDAASHIPVAGRIFRRPSVVDYVKAATTKRGSIADSFQDLGAPLPAEPDPALLKSQSLATTKTPAATPASQTGEALGQAPKRGSIAESMQTPAAAKPITRGSLNKLMGDQLERGLGAKELDPKAPLRSQMDGIPPGATDVPKGHTAVQSSALKSYQYDPAAREFHTRYSSGGDTTHVFGDVSPEEAQAFEKAQSKGQAMQAIKNSHPLVAKIVNGKRVSVKGSISAGMAK